MRRIFSLAAALVVIGCSDDGMATSPEMGTPQFTMGDFSSAYLAGLMSRLGRAEHLHHETENSRTVVACDPPTELRFDRVWKTVTQFWSQFDPVTTVSESYQMHHHVQTMSYVNVETGKTVTSRAAHETGSYWVYDSFGLNDQQAWQSGNVFSFVSQGDGRVQYRSGRSVFTSTWEDGQPTITQEFVGTEDVSSLCPILLRGVE